MSNQSVIEFLLQYPGADVQKCAVTIKADFDRKHRVLSIIQEALQQLRLDVKYMIFDRDCLQKERDEAYTKLSNGPFGESK